MAAAASTASPLLSSCPASPWLAVADPASPSSMAWPGKARPAAESSSPALLVVSALLHLSLVGTVLFTKPRQASTRSSECLHKFDGKLRRSEHGDALFYPLASILL
ncbi:unnamed protein product [Urochloa humidicola]